MARKTISAAEAGQNFEDMLDNVVKQADSFVVEANGERIAAVVPIDMYDSMQRSKDRIVQRVEVAAARANLTEEEAELVANETVETVRAGRRSRA